MTTFNLQTLLDEKAGNCKMNELEATRAKLKCLEMVEGTGLSWWKVVRAKGVVEACDFPPEFNRCTDSYEFALGIVEGKPVWDKEYSNS